MSANRTRALMTPGACLITDAVDVATAGRDYRRGHGVRPVAIVDGGRVEFAYLPGPVPETALYPSLRVATTNVVNGAAGGSEAGAKVYEFVIDAEGIVRSLRSLGTLGGRVPRGAEAAD